MRMEELGKESIGSLREAYGSIQMAAMRIPLQALQKLLSADKVRIGWVVCRLREQILLKKCFLASISPIDAEGVGPYC